MNMNTEDKVFSIVAIAAIGFIVYKATRKDDNAIDGGYANAAGAGAGIVANSTGGQRISHTRWQPATAATSALSAPVKQVPQNTGVEYSSKPMWMKALEKKIFFWRKD